MRVIDPQRLFADEPQQRVRVALLQHLGGHIAPAAMVEGAPDGADAPASDRVDQFVAPGEDLTHGCASLLPLRLPPCFPHDERYDSPSLTVLRGLPRTTPSCPLRTHTVGPAADTPSATGPGGQFWWDW